jgi:ATP phosphoribosyltransferase regulatory subunit HisZ
VAGDIRFRFTGDQFEAVYDDEIADVLPRLGSYAVRRASYVEPCGEGWTANMAPMGGGVLGPFKLRADALKAEREWLADVWGL